MMQHTAGKYLVFLTQILSYRLGIELKTMHISVWAMCHNSHYTVMSHLKRSSQ